MRVDRMHVACAILLVLVFAPAGVSAARRRLPVISRASDLPLVPGSQFRPDGVLRGGWLRRDVVYRGVPVRGRIDLYEDGTISFANISGERFVYRGIPVSGGISLAQDGKLQSARLSRDFAVAGVRLSLGSEFSLFPSGKLRSVTSRSLSEWRGVPVEGDKGIALYESGALASFLPPVPSLVGNVKVAAGERCHLYASGRLQRATLAEAQRLGGLLLKAGSTVGLHESGKLKGGTLAEAQTVQAWGLPGGAVVELDDQGRLVEIDKAAPLRFHGIAVRGDHLQFPMAHLPTLTAAGRQRYRGIDVPDGARVIFSRDGRLKRIYSATMPIHAAGLDLREGLDVAADGTMRGQLARPQTKDGIALAAQEVELHASGRLKRGTLAGAQTVAGLPALGGSTIELYASGKVESLFLAAPRKIQGLLVTNQDDIAHHLGGPPFVICGSEPVELYESGKLKAASLAKPQTISGVDLDGGPREHLPQREPKVGPESRITLHENGVLMSATLKRDQKIRGIRFKAGKIELHPNGSPKQGALARETTLGGVVFMKGSGIALHPDGQPSSGVLARATTLDGLTLPAGAAVELDTQGRLARQRMTEASIVQGVALPAGAELLGRRIAAVLPKAMMLLGVPLPAGTLVFLPRSTADIGLSGSVRVIVPGGSLAGVPLAKDYNVELLQWPERRFAVYLAERPLVTREGLVLRADSLATFNAQGALLEGTLGERTSYRGRSLREGDRITLSPSGELREAPEKVTRPHVEAGVSLAVGDEIMSRFDDGSLEVVRLVAPRTIQGFECSVSGEVELYANGRLRRFTPVNDLRIGELALRSWAEVELYPSGAVKAGFPADPLYQEGQQVTFARVLFDEQGRVLGRDLFREAREERTRVH